MLGSLSLYTVTALLMPKKDGSLRMCMVSVGTKIYKMLMSLE